MTIILACASCQSPNVMRDAWAIWDVDTQSWVLQSVLDHSVCEDCGEDSRLEEIIIAEPAVANAP